MRILRGAERLERSRTLVDTDAFAATLRDRVVGAEDLLALLAVERSARRHHNW
jgi:hypothetical protein